MKIRIIKYCRVQGDPCKPGDEVNPDKQTAEGLIRLGYAEVWTDKKAKKKGDGSRINK